MNKSDIRKKIISLRRRKFNGNLEIKSNLLFKLFKEIKINSKIIGGYYPFNFELDILDILQKLEKKNFIISLPRVNKNNKMDFFIWSHKDPLKINKYGIPETTSQKKVFPNILLIPLVAFDNQLYRLGYGGGYYDRYISRFESRKKLIKIGVGFTFQKVKKIPINKYDKKLNYLITEKGIIR